MTHPTDPLDRLVEDYLAEVARATAWLPAGRRDDLIADLREHIAVARAELHPPTAAGIHTILDRLGEPAAIAEEARLGEQASGGYSPPAPTISQSAVPRQNPPSTATLVLGVLLILIVIMVGACAVTLFAADPDDDASSVLNSRTSQTALALR
ncbi:HAAS signaling domain-containing protein [Nonomuraea sp. NPDC049269]|uniref:HAAS signaling domain-containing protein n=1 Tax=Nonomuraea sp. NPDC049269 TaxID=3364349 RepID=UPI003721465E